MNPPRPLTLTDPRHGSEAGYRAHRREGSQPCTRCVSGHNAYERDRTAIRVKLGLEAR